MIVHRLIFARLKECTASIGDAATAFVRIQERSHKAALDELQDSMVVSAEVFAATVEIGMWNAIGRFTLGASCT